MSMDLIIRLVIKSDQGKEFYLASVDAPPVCNWMIWEIMDSENREETYLKCIQENIPDDPEWPEYKEKLFNDFFRLKEIAASNTFNGVKPEIKWELI